MIPRTFVPAMSASTEGPLAAPAAPPRARPPPGAFRGALGPASAAERPLPSVRAAPAAAPRGASAATSAAAACSSARVSVVPQEGHAKPSAVSLSAAATAPAATFSFFPALSAGAVGSASTRVETQSPQKRRAQHDATVGSDGGSPQMEHTQRPCSATARIIPRSAAGKRRAAAVADAGTATRAPAGTETRVSVSFEEPATVGAVSALERFALEVTSASAARTPPTSDGWLHAWRKRSSMCNRLT